MARHAHRTIEQRRKGIIKAGIAVPGKINNPFGRPKLGDSAAEAARAVCDGMITEQTAKTPLQIAFAAQIKKAMMGDGNALEIVTKRAYGNTIQKTEVEDITEAKEFFQFYVVDSKGKVI